MNEPNVPTQAAAPKPTATLREALNAWLSEMKQANFSAMTLKCYQYRIRNYEYWLKRNPLMIGEPLVTHFNLQPLKEYRATFETRPRSVRAAIACLTSFGEYLVRERHLPDNPAKELIKPKKDAVIRTMISEDELRKLCEAAPRIPKPYDTLYPAMWFVLVTTGIRREELINLEVSDIDLREKVLVVRSGKGQKRRVVFLPEDCCEFLAKWLHTREQMRPTIKSLWCISHSRKVGYESVSKMIGQVKSIAGMPEAKHIHPHTIRHCFATRLLRNGADVVTIQQLLGHSHLTTTAIYLHTDELSLKNVSRLQTPFYARRNLQDNKPAANIEPEEPKAPTVKKKTVDGRQSERLRPEPTAPPKVKMHRRLSR